jgi:hypothetical protein
LKNRTILLGVAVLTIGFLVMPSTVSMFTGQHQWQDKWSIQCTRCHADIQTELESASNNHHKAADLGVADTDAACRYCHQTEFGSPGAWDDVNGTPGTAHAAINVECLDCHGSTDQDTNIPSADEVDTEFGATEAHQELYDNATASSFMAGANEACVACHTLVTIQDGGYFIFNKQMNITADETVWSGGWVVTFDVYNP